jgi:tRNA threonylcarbamoyladenosine biosynthesis protein TsaE
VIERVEVADPEGMRALGARLGAVLRAGDLVVLTGPLGAGKTTLASGLGGALGVRGPITSPTFVLARTHPSLVGGPPLVHVDAYRLGSAGELDDLDLDYEHAVVVVEWGEGLLDGVSDSVLEVVLARPGLAEDPGDDAPVEPRTVELRRSGPRWADAPPLLG